MQARFRTRIYRRHLHDAYSLLTIRRKEGEIADRDRLWTTDSYSCNLRKVHMGHETIEKVLKGFSSDDRVAKSGTRLFLHSSFLAPSRLNSAPTAVARLTSSVVNFHGAKGVIPMSPKEVRKARINPLATSGAASFPASGKNIIGLLPSISV